MLPFHRRSPVAQHYAHLLPFLAVAGYGLFILIGWWGGQVSWVQPRSYDVPLSANAALCLLLLGLAPLAVALGQSRVGVALALLAAAIGCLSATQGLTGVEMGLDNLLVRHQALVAGAHVARIPTVLAGVFAAAGFLLTWYSLPRPHPLRPFMLACTGSLAGAYGLVTLLASRIGLTAVEDWQHHAHLGPHTAVALLVLSLALILLAARDSRGPAGSSGPRWLWLPVVAATTTTTLLFWMSLREREVGYINSTTQLTINNIAALYSGDVEGHIHNLNRMAARWTDASGLPQENWEREARALQGSFPAYRTISWVDADYRTRWLWPTAGNEDDLSFNHTSHPLRRQAMRFAHDSLTYGLAAPLVTPGKPPSFAIYATVLREGRFDGFIVGELGYRPMVEVIDRRLDISSRYLLTVSIWTGGDRRDPQSDVTVYESATPATADSERVRQSAVFNLFNQRITIQLLPRAEFINPRRQYLPELVLVSGLTLSGLLGLVINLAQAARSRQRAAESTSAQLRAENEERRRVEAQLKVTDERLNLALDATQVGVYEWDVLTDEVIYSPSVWTSLGYDPAQMPSTYQVWIGLIHPEDIPDYQAAVASHFRGETAFIELEYRIRHANGDWQWVSARAKCVTWDTHGQPTRVTGTCQNITARRLAEEALRASQAATRVLTHVARRTENVVFITTPNGNIEWANDSFSRLTGYAAADVKGYYLLDLLSSPDTAPQALAEITQALLRVEPITTEVIAKSAGSERSYHLRLELQPVKNEQGEAENFIAMGTDITTSVQTEANLRRAKTEADAASRAKSEFLATMSHEIRTPMNGVIGMTSLLLDTPLTPEQRDYVSTIRTSGDALLAVINEILDFSKIESGKLELENQPMEIAQCIEEAIDIFALQAAAKRIELTYYIHPGVPPWILLDATRVRQVLVNLVNNAVKFTVEGTITIEVAPATVPDSDNTRPPIMLKDGERQMIDFFVRDTGIGIPPERRHLLFKPFSQVDSSTTRKYGGTGLGLAICDRLCQLMGGTIDASENPGGGSVFHFCLMAEPVAAPVDPHPRPLPETLQRTNVLVVDDLPLNRHLLAQTVSRLHLHALEAAHLHDASEIALQQKISAAIVDVELMGEDGIPFADELRRRFPDLPVILLTNPMESAKRANSSDPCQARLPKPIKPALLIQTLHRLLTTGAAHGDTTPPVPMTAGPTLAESIPLEVLLVEDNPVNQKVALRFLQRLGYNADAVGNGLEAVHAFQQRDYDLVFMDMQMPEMDGLTATREIRSRFPRERQPKIVALTANVVQGDRERCLAAGMDDYLSKPLRFEALEQMIRKYFQPTKGD
ncbi:MAG: response regulator [Opitutae bacterium]|nr:response regulator [Opitutae bacterium]